MKINMKVALVGLGVAALALSSIPQASAYDLDIRMAADGTTTYNVSPLFDTLTIVNTWAGPGLFNQSVDHPGSWFTTYSAHPVLPQVGSDLKTAYGWNLTLTKVSENLGANTAVYTGTYYLFAPGYGYTVADYLEKATVSVTASFNLDRTSAALAGSFLAEAGTRQPTGWGGPVDWSLANPGSLIQGTWNLKDFYTPDPPHVAGKDYVTMRVVGYIPEPAFFQMGALIGMSGLGLLKLRKRV